MRILHISTRLILGGSQENTVLSCEGQAELGHEVHLAHGPIYGPEGSLADRVAAFRTSDGRTISTHIVPAMMREMHPSKDIACYRQLGALIDEIKPDIVHTHSSKAGIIGRAAAWRGGRRRASIGVVHTVHGPPFHEHEKRWRNAVYIAAERWAAKRCHAIVTVCDAMRDRYLAARIGRPALYTTVYSGMEVDPYLHPGSGPSREEVRRELGLAGSDIVIGTVARLFELKGHDDILEALGDDLRADPRLKLLWVGDGLWRQRLTHRIAEMGLTRSVVMAGLVPPQRVPAMIRAMDLLIHASYREGLPRAVVQSLLSGVQVVATDIDGTREVCVDQITGRLVPVGDTGAIREATRWMLADPARGRATALEGRERCRVRFDARTMVAELEKVYARVLAEARSA